MAEVFFYLLAALSVMALLDGLRERNGFFQFQTILAASFLFSTIPQLVNYVFRPGRLPDVVVQDHGVELGLLMCLLCLLAGVIGYRLPLRRQRTPAAFNFSMSVDKMFWAGCVLCIVGLIGAWKLAQLAGGFKAQFLGGTHYQLEFKGVAVVYTYVARTLIPGLALCWLSVLARGSVLKWVTTTLFMLYPLAITLFLGRRGSTFTIMVVVVFALWFQKRWAPPRLVALLAFVLAGLFVIVAPTYRTQMMGSGGNVAQAVAEADFGEATDKYLNGEIGEGMDHLIVGIPARLKKWQYGYGGQFWNALVEQFVPGQFVGYELKQSLIFPINAYESDIYLEYCGFSVGSDAFLTGPYSAFIDFSFFGCFLYYFMARFYKRLWMLANATPCASTQLCYIMLCYPITTAVINSVQVALTHAVFALVVVVPVLWFLKAKTGGRRKAAPKQSPADVISRGA